MTQDEIIGILRQIAPEETALPDDPIGLLIHGDRRGPVTKIGVCLDATPEAVTRAAEAGAPLLVTHHPLIFHPLKRIITETDRVGKTVVALVKADISLYAMHTNWDRTAGGINDTLADLLELERIRPLGTEGAVSLPRIGTLKFPRTPADFRHDVQTALNCGGTSALRVNPVNPQKMISRVAVCGGAGAFLIPEVIAAGADAFVTSDVRHHEFLDAAARGLALLDAGHDATETPGMHALARLLTVRLDGVEVIWVGGD